LKAFAACISVAEQAPSPSHLRQPAHADPRQHAPHLRRRLHAQLGIVGRHHGLSAGIYYFVNLEKVDEVPDDLFRVSVAYEF
jgi:hypothetical protein